MILIATLSSDLLEMQSSVNLWVAAITEYVSAFVKFIMPLFIYVIVFKIVLSKS